MPEDERAALESGAKNLQWFAENFTVLQEEYLDRFVAVHDGKLVDTDSSVDALLDRIEGRVDLKVALVEFVPASDRILVI